MTVTASSLERVLACPGSAALPHANTSSVWSEQGTDGHAEQDDAIKAGDLPEHLAAFLGDAAATVKSEVKLAFNVATREGRVIGCGGDRVYPDQDGPFWLYGTTDVLAHDADRVYIADRKLYTAATAAERNVQLGFYALASAAALGKSEATVGLFYEARKPDVATLDVLDMDALALRLRSIHASVAEQRAKRTRGELVDVREGSWCKHCPAAHACPAKVALIKRMVTGGEADDLELMLPLTAETARIAYERLGHAKQLLKRIESAIYAFGAEQPFPIGDGKFFGKHTTPGKESLDGRIVRDVVSAHLSPEAVDEVVTYKATKSALAAAVKKRAPKGQAAACERDILAEIRKRGGATREESETVGEFVPRLHAAEDDAA